MTSLTLTDLCYDELYHIYEYLEDDWDMREIAMSTTMLWRAYLQYMSDRYGIKKWVTVMLDDGIFDRESCDVVCRKCKINTFLDIGSTLCYQCIANTLIKSPNCETCKNRIMKGCGSICLTCDNIICWDCVNICGGKESICEICFKHNRLQEKTRVFNIKKHDVAYNVFRINEMCKQMDNESYDVEEFVYDVCRMKNIMCNQYAELI